MIYYNRAQAQIALPHFSHLRLALSSLWENEYLYSESPTAPSPARYRYGPFLLMMEKVIKNPEIGRNKLEADE
jgi:hypothetical protein